MMVSLSYSLLKALRRGAESLSGEARQRVCRFVNGQRTDGEAFVNRGGQPDLYYTLFGWMLCYALDIPTDGKQRKMYLRGFDAGRLDELHQTVLTLCRMVDRLHSPSLLTPLSSFLMDDAPLRLFFETYQRHGSGGGTNAWAARLAAASEADSELTEKLLAMQHVSGGFLAYRGVAMPDLLSTAVALFALQRHHVRPRYDVNGFIEAHWQEDGSFAATLLDEHGDVEYEFYGLLALGNI